MPNNPQTDSTIRIMAYIINHWRGNLSLVLSGWINFLALLILLSFLEPLILSLFTADPDRLTTITLCSLMITRLVVFPWQVVGLIRAAENDFRQHRYTLRYRSIQVVVVLSVLYTLIYGVETVQTVIIYRKQVTDPAQPIEPQGYRLAVEDSGRRLVITGALDIGITQVVRSLIKTRPQLSTVVLESRGGQIYQGRGLAHLFTENRLDTITYHECSSACATAYIGGIHRSVGKHGKLGFHQYKFDTTHIRPFTPLYDLIAEQQRDLALYRSRGIDQSILDKIFNQPAEKIWFPEHAELIASGVVHSILEQHAN